MSLPTIGIAGIGTYFPPHIETAAEIVERTGIPESILQQKMGIVQRHIAGETDTISHMATIAAQRALEDAGIPPSAVGAVISHGSEHKDHLVWNAAAKIQGNLGAVNAFAFEVYALCAGAAIAVGAAQGLMIANPSLACAVLVAASREHDLVNLSNPRTRFMTNFGAGAGAMVLARDYPRNHIVGMSAFTDGSLAEAVILSQSREVAGERPEVSADLRGKLDVIQPEYMTERLGETSLRNFVRVIEEATSRAGAGLGDIAFLGITHMKRSFYEEILAAVGLTPAQSVYLQDYGHVQSADQVLALQLGLQAGTIRPGDLVVLAGAGVGYTWSALAIRWG
ncbi:MAG TPA: 3-oxoacyl-ACP synthase [Aggregatilineales bacterium]|nr:3-oxoacyl-ACP synthase [Anaerolineales bacterium]HRE46129.1 3-oxoacyl-ACP synthase [Aggregatilineales bacterium]